MARHFLRRPLRADTRGVSAVVGTLLAVAITIILGTVLYVLVTGILSPPPPPPVSVVLSSNGWVGGTYTATVAGVVNTQNLQLGDLTYKVEDAYSNIYFTGKSGESKTSNGITVTVTFQDTNSDDRVTETDVIRITVDPASSGAQAVSGGVLRLITGNSVISNHSIE